MTEAELGLSLEERNFGAIVDGVSAVILGDQIKVVTSRVIEPEGDSRIGAEPTSREKEEFSLGIKEMSPSLTINDVSPSTQPEIFEGLEPWQVEMWVEELTRRAEENAA